MNSGFVYTDSHGHVHVELPAESVEVVAAVLLKSDLIVALFDASLDGYDIGVLTSLILVCVEVSFDSEFLL